ncbi:hypothetical protein Ancab_001404 [Ancistrocladus abbreviatus]
MLRVISKMRDSKVSRQLEQEEDALSFSNLHTNSPAYRDSSVSEDLHSRSSFSSCHHYDNDENDDLFEFFNADFTASSLEVDNRDIIFCGKTIPLRKPLLSSDQAADGMPQSKNSNHKSSQTSPDMKKHCFLNYWRRSLSLSRTKTDDENHTKANWARDSSKKSLPKMENYRKLTPNSSRWYWLRLGSMKVRSKMDLDEIRSRQSRQTPKALEMKRQPDRNRSGAIGYSSCRPHPLITVVRAISCISSI